MMDIFAKYHPEKELLKIIADKLVKTEGDVA